MNLTEAFRALDALNEDTFSVSDDGINKLSDFEQNDDLVDEISVIDPEAETEDDLQGSYVGKVILDCGVCHSKIYKDKSEVELDDEQALANVGEECPYCYTSDGFKVIGEVAEFGGNDDEEDDKDTEETEVAEDDSTEDKDEEEIEEYLKESVNAVDVTTDDETISFSTDENGNVSLSTAPTGVESGDEMLVPISDETQSEIESNDEEGFIADEEEIPMSDFDEESFDELGESYLKGIYENVNSYKTTQVRSRGNKLTVEGVIKFNSGNAKKTSFIFEAKDITKSGKVRFIGENVNITRGKKAFSVRGRVDGKRFISESLNYNYRQKDESGKSTRVYGTVRTQKRG